MTTTPGGGTVRAALDASLSEAEWMRLVVETAQRLHWTVYHTRDSRGSTAGFPDICAVHPGPPARLAFFELKTEGGRVAPEQQQWIDALGAVPGVVAFVARPHQWDDVRAVLMGEGT
jgi:hypothetical protein